MGSRIGSDDGSLPGVGAAASPWVAANLSSRACGPTEGDEIVFQFVQDFGEITAGTRLASPHAGRGSDELNCRPYLPVDAAGAEIVANDGQGRPALLRNPVGSGCALLRTHQPLERLAACTPRVKPFAVAAIACRNAVGRQRKTERDLVLQATSMVGRAERRDAAA